MSLVSIYRASNFYCMVIAAEMLSLTGSPSALDWVAIGIAAAIVASAAIAVVAAADSIITAPNATAVNTANAAVATPLAALAGNNDENAITTLKRASVISSIAKISLRAYFEEADWPLNKALPRGAEFACGLLGDIVWQYCLKKPSFSIAFCKTVRANSQRRRRISSRAMRISVATNAGFLKIFVIVARFPLHLTTGSMHPQTLLDTKIFEAQWPHRFLLLQFWIQDSARKTNPSQGLINLSSNTPW